MARRVFCAAYHHQLYGPKYVWILPGLFQTHEHCLKMSVSLLSKCKEGKTALFIYISSCPSYGSLKRVVVSSLVQRGFTPEQSEKSLKKVCKLQSKRVEDHSKKSCPSYGFSKSAFSLFYIQRGHFGAFGVLLSNPMGFWNTDSTFVFLYLKEWKPLEKQLSLMWLFKECFFSYGLRKMKFRRYFTDFP